MYFHYFLEEKEKNKKLDSVVTEFGKKYTHALYHISSFTFRYESQRKEKESKEKQSDWGVFLMEVLLKDSLGLVRLQNRTIWRREERQNMALNSAVHQKFISKMD